MSSNNPPNPQFEHLRELSRQACSKNSNDLLLLTDLEQSMTEGKLHQQSCSMVEH